MITDLKAFCETRLFLKASCPVSDISQKTRTILSRSPSAIMVI